MLAFDSDVIVGFLQPLLQKAGKCYSELQLLFLCFVQVYATGYGHGGRLGLGGTETVTSVRLIESLQHVVIKKVAVHSGGKHAMALSMDGNVYSWGEGEDGKLGHGSRG